MRNLISEESAGTRFISDKNQNVFNEVIIHKEQSVNMYDRIYKSNYLKNEYVDALINNNASMALNSTLKILDT